MFLTQDQLESFRTRGFVVLRGFYDSAAVAALSATLDALRDSDAEGQECAKYYEESPLSGETILVRIENVLGEHNADFTEQVLSPKANGCLTELFGEPPLLFKDKINYKLPGCRADKLHQDQAAGWNRYCDFFITMAVAVDQNRRDNAALSFLATGGYERDLMTEEWQPLSEADPPYQPEDDYLLLEADPGDVVFFDSYVPHGSPANTSERSRRNLFLTFNRQSAGDLRARYYADKWASYAPNRAEGARSQDSFRV